MSESITPLVKIQIDWGGDIGVESHQNALITDKKSKEDKSSLLGERKRILN